MGWRRGCDGVGALAPGREAVRNVSGRLDTNNLNLLNQCLGRNQFIPTIQRNSVNPALVL